jgi:two-component system, chemotaxis family, protein-glutamate methylesterase/glutaminase
MTAVLVVDDSSFARLSIIKLLSKDPDIQIVGYARDGIEAIEKVKEYKPDVITLDVQMPNMDGLEALKKIMDNEPTPVVMLSSLTDKGTEITVRALEIGAVDFYLKSSLTSPEGSLGLNEDLIQKIKLAADAGKKKLRLQTLRKKNQSIQKNNTDRQLTSRSKVVVIGSSTGGPGALYEVVPGIPGDIPAAILIVQHMPRGFTKSLAARLNDLSQIKVKEAEEGDKLYEGQAFVAPGNYHMTVNKDNKISLNQQPSVLGLRPCANVTMQSVAGIFGRSSIGIVLTGMGSDGTEGSKHIKSAGGKVAVQDENTCVIYGMPRSVVESGSADKVVPLQNIAAEITRMCSE